MPLFSPKTWPFAASLLPADAYLVGGSVRDRLLNRQTPYLDLDFVLPNNAIQTASNIAKAHNAGFVVLDAERQIARVVFEQVTVDFAQQQGESLETDLRRRDFTINAIAYSPTQHQLIDPLGGETDLQRKTMRMVSTENLSEDPLRLLRAYRQAAQLSFTIEPQTRSAIAQLAPKLQTVAMERIHSELDALLSAPLSTSSQILESLCETKLLQFCLPQFTADSIPQIVAIETALSQLQDNMPAYAARLHSWPKPVPAGSYRSWSKAAKLSRLVSADPAIALKQLDTLKYSRNEAQVIATLLKAQPCIKAMQHGPLARSQQFFLFKQVGPSFLALSLLALAQDVDLSLLQPLITRFEDSQDKIAHSKPLLTGTQLMKQLGISPGPAVGKALKALEKMQATGELQSEEGAIAWVKQNFL